MDIGLVAAIIMLIVWAIGTFALEAPGWIHVLLTLGMFLLIWRIAVMSGDHSSDPADSGNRAD
jgi:hypothetical protein